MVVKTRVTCTGPTPVQVRVIGKLVSGGLQFGPTTTRASSDQTQGVANDGNTITTYYTPMRNEPGVRGSGWYTGSITAEVVAPVASGPWSAASGEVWVTTP